MNNLYISIVALVLYGDMLKRVLPAQVSLIVLYALAAIILVVIFIIRDKEKPQHNFQARSMMIVVITLIILYVIQMLLSINVPFIRAVTNATYISIPLLYIVVILRFYHKFDLVKLARVFLVFMVPINIVGLIQYYIDPTFMISTAYSGEFGGIIYRNFLIEGSYFTRYPSIFASADRYSAMGLMQLFFTFIILSKDKSTSRKKQLWLLINFLSGAMALLIAGARSRIIITIIEFAVFFIVFLLAGKRKSNSLWRKTNLWVAATAIIFTFGLLILVPQLTDDADNGDLFPVIKLFSQSIERGDITSRVSSAGNVSLIPVDVTVFGQGLGSEGESGKPGEFGMRSIWIESGLFFGILLITGFISIILILFYSSYQQFKKLNPAGVVLYSFPSLLVIFSLLAGLSSAFELSSGILLGSIIGALLGNSCYRNYSL